MDTTIEKIHSLLIRGAGVSTDSRKIEEGCIFFALKGENFDANDFALQAVEKGAALAVVDNTDLEKHEKFIFVEDSLKALQDLAVFHRSQFNIPVLGITGSNGKTTTKELVNAVLSKKYRTLFTAGNLNNHIGVPLTLLRLNNSHEIAIIEMGANHVGEIGFLSSLAKPTLGLITNIGKAHIEGFGSFENIIKGKTELYDYIRSTGGSIFLNSDNEILSGRSSGMHILTYGKSPEASVSGSIISSQPFLSVVARSTEHPESFPITSRLLGIYNFENIMSAVAAGLHFGVSQEEIAGAIEDYYPVNSRSQLKETERNTLILDSYNANPTSMKAAIENFSSMESKLPKIVILGDMLEMGDTAETEHNDIIKLTTEYPYRYVLLTGENFHRLCPDKSGYYSFPDAQSLCEWLVIHQLTGNIILIKGSRGIQLEKVEKFI
jgi:UDP-N-acetylmuramoyl-tripeptide--D-alanyl-D-alanine ligase